MAGGRQAISTKSPMGEHGHIAIFLDSERGRVALHESAQG